MKRLNIALFLIVFLFFFTYPIQSVSNPLCIILDKNEVNPMCLLMADLQAEIGSDCGAGFCVYGVNDDGTLDCRDCTTGSGNTTEQIQDTAWSVLTGTQTRITVTYQDVTNDVDFVVDDMTSTYNYSYDVKPNNTYNSSYEWFLNTTIFQTYNSSYEWYDNTTIFLTYNATYDAKPDNTYNATYDSKPDDTFNSTYDAKPDNVYNSSYEWFNNATIFLTYNSSYDSKPDNTYNSTYDAKPDDTYNATYDAYTDTANTTAEIQAVVNTTEYGTFNTTILFIPSGFECWNIACTINRTYNGTCIIDYGSTSTIEVC